MPNKRLSMRKIHEVLRLNYEARLSRRAIARCLNISDSTVRLYLERAQAAGLTWPLDQELDQAPLEALLFPPPPRPLEGRPRPNWAEVHQERKRSKSVTLRLLWLEYKQQHPDGFQYSWFCEHYRRWRGKLDLVMRQDHRAGEKLFVDYAGETVEVKDPKIGEVRQAQIFVAVLGASNYTYCEATWTQALEDWTSSHVRAFAFFGGVPEIIVPDNLKAGVDKAHRYEPDLNPTYAEMAAHYGTVVMPARVRKPRDKAKVEAGVLLVERWILARLRKQCFFSLAELNQAISVLRSALNAHPFQKLPGTRCSLFEQLDRPALKPLPATHYQYAQWKQVLLGPDYHVEAKRHYYSVPSALVAQRIDVRITATTIECFFKAGRVASHVRRFEIGGHTTVEAHRPKAHRLYGESTPEHVLKLAQGHGPSTVALVKQLLAHSGHVQQGLRSSVAVLRLSTRFEPERLEAACQRALSIGAMSFKSVESILKTGLDRTPVPDPESSETSALPLEHANLRGAHYYR